MIISFVFSACTPKLPQSTINAGFDVTPIIASTPALSPTYAPTSTPDTRMVANFSDPKIIGSSRAILCAGIENSDILEDVGFVVAKPNGEIIAETSAELYEDNYYLIIDNLEPDTEYTLKMYYIISDAKEYTKNEITFETPANTQIFVRGMDSQVVGQIAADIRAVRKPEPYLGKGIRYADEHVRRKEGKAAT